MKLNKIENSFSEVIPQLCIDRMLKGRPCDHSAWLTKRSWTSTICIFVKHTLQRTCTRETGYLCYFSLLTDHDTKTQSTRKRTVLLLFSTFFEKSFFTNLRNSWSNIDYTLSRRFLSEIFWLVHLGKRSPW